MKRHSKEAIRSKVAKQIKEMQHSESISTDTRTGREQLQSILAPDIVTLPAREKYKPEPKSEIVLYLRDGVNPADKNFTKYPNEMHDLMTERLTEYESLLYIKFWRESWGYGKNYCRIGYSTLLKETSLRSKSTVTRAVTGLREKRFIVLALDEASNPKTTQVGTIYRIFAPSEILDGKTEEGILLQSIPIEGILCRSILNKNIPEKPHKQDNDTGIFRVSIPQQGILTKKSGQGDDTGIVSQGIVTKNIPANSGYYKAEGYIQREYTQREYTFKEDSLKDSLSLDQIVISFYRGVGQERITKEKRERANSCIEELIKDGFLLDDIEFTVNWTLNNAKEKPYDFSIIKHTIGQAMAAKETVKAATTRKLQKEKIEAQEQADEKKREEEKAQIDSYKETLNSEERAKLRERAEAEIRESGQYKAEFITEHLIEAKESELIKGRIGI